MSKRSAHFYRNEFGKSGPRPRDIERVNQHVQRKRTRAQLRTYRYLRAPQLFLADVAVGAGMGFGVLAVVMVAMGVVR